MQIVNPEDQRQVQHALAHIFAREDGSPLERDLQIDSFLRHLRRTGLSISDCRTISDDDALCGACLCVDAPGRTANLLIPPGSTLSSTHSERLAQLVDQVAVAAAARDVQLVQAMLPVHDTAQARVLSEVGFVRLARLLYLERELNCSVLPPDPLPPVTWATFASQGPRVFADVLAGTYEGSHDCAALSGRRSIDDILASHRAAGPFDPTLWSLASVANRPVGVLLAARLPDRTRHEVVYVGLLPPYRGHGYGAALMARALAQARQDAASAVTLAVDERNLPARRLYERFAFQEWMRRDAWVRFLDEGTDTARD